MDALKAVVSQLGLDQTIIPVFALVIILHIVLSFSYLKPYQKLLHNRKRKTEGARKDADELSAKADEKLSQYKQRVKEANDRAKKIFLDIENVAKQEESKLISEAGESSRRALQEVQSSILKNKKSVFEAVEADVPVIAAEIASKVLGRSLTGSR